MNWFSNAERLNLLKQIIPMTKQDFIFSNERRHRIARHVSFWGVWCIAYLLLFHYPLHSFSGWGFNQADDPQTYESIRQIGLPLYILKTLIFQSLLMVVVPQAIFIYVLINWVLPNYFFKKRNVFFIAFILISVFVIYYFIAAEFKGLHFVGEYIFGVRKNPPAYHEQYDLCMYMALRDNLISLPVIAGFAIIIKLMKRWWLIQKETEQLLQAKTTAELQLLKAQVHPHFLFNTLNNIYYFTLSGSRKAPEMIDKLSGLLHYILNECNQPSVQLQKEINMLRDYMALEKIRYGEQMNMIIDIQEEGSEKLIAPLLLIPFVENSFKHGTSKMLAHPWLKLQMTIENNMLHFSVANSRPQEAKPHVKKGNIGLKNVKKRLELLYPGNHELNIVCEPGSFFVSLKVTLQEANGYAATNENVKTIADYAVA
jgi:two-component system LytT family sensor kinase